MKKLLMISLSGLILLCTFFANAGEELEAINAEVEKTAAQIDHDYGVLLTGQERRKLKISLIVSKMTDEQQNIFAKEKADKAIKVYEITDPTEQRSLLIEMSVAGGGGGVHP
jgi:hypothetical protein